MGDSRPFRVAAIPVRDHWREFTEPLLDHLLNRETVDCVLVMDNGSTDETWPELCALVREYPNLVARFVPGIGLYRMWNRALGSFKLAAGDDLLVDLLLVNNDVRLPAGLFDALSAVLRGEVALVAVSPNPDRSATEPIVDIGHREVVGSYRNGGLLGWCFMVKAEDPRVGRFDEDYEWWYGDDDAFAAWVKAGGVLARVLGVGCDHVGEGTASDGQHGWTHAAKDRDRERFEAKWGKGSGW